MTTQFVPHVKPLTPAQRRILEKVRMRGSCTFNSRVEKPLKTLRDRGLINLDCEPAPNGSKGPILYWTATPIEVPS